MKHPYKSILFLPFFLMTIMVEFLSAQNLVPNPSFEAGSCPTGRSGVSQGHVTSWGVPPGAGSTPELFDPCYTTGSGCDNVHAPDNWAGIATAFSGNRYVGILTSSYNSPFNPNAREYLQAQLTNPLAAGTKYCVRFRVRRASDCRKASNNLGMYFSNATVSQSGGKNIAVTPQVEYTKLITDSAKWTLVSGTYTSVGGERYITIGNFRSDANTQFYDYGSYSGSCLLGGGSYYLIDSVFVGSCGGSPALLTTATSTNILCNGQCTGTGTANPSNGAPPYTYTWSSGGQTTKTATGLCAETYTITVTDAANTTATATVTITQPPPLVVNAGSNVTITQGASATLTASGGGSYSWSNGTTDLIITVSPSITTLYCVTVADANNCTDTACVTVTVIVEPLDCSTAGELYIPNAFSPNNDGENDVLQIYYRNALCIKTMHLVIYDRWGEAVFETTGISPEYLGWNGKYEGKTMHTEVLVYYLQATMIDGKEIVKKGNISLVK